MYPSEITIAAIAATMTAIASPGVSTAGGGTPGPAGGAEAVALQLVEPLALGSALEVAVTTMVVESPPAAPLGTVTVSVAVPEAPAARVSEFGEIPGDHPAPPETRRSKLSVASPVFVTVTV